MKTFRLLTALTLGTLLWGCAESGKKAEGPFYTDIESRAQLHDWFRYAPERPIVVSGHRGGMVTGYPENCIESFEKTLSKATSRPIRFRRSKSASSGAGARPSSTSTSRTCRWR